MTHYTVCCGYASHYHNTVTVEADTLDAALEKAIEQAVDDPHWKSVDQSSQTFIEALAKGEDADPWGDTVLPVPDRFTVEPANATGSSELANGEPPVVTLTGLRPRDGFDVAGRPDRERYPARNALPAYPAASHTRFGVPLSFPGLSRVCRPLPLHAAPAPPTHASTPGRARAWRWRSISGAPEGAVSAAIHPSHLPAWSMP